MKKINSNPAKNGTGTYWGRCSPYVTMATGNFTFLFPNNKKSRQNSLHSEALDSPPLLWNSQLVWDNSGGGGGGGTNYFGFCHY